MRPRCVRIVAGAGWGKTALCRALEGALPSKTAVVHCRGLSTIEEFDASLAEALSNLGEAVDAADLTAAWRRSTGSNTIIIDECAVLVGIDRAIDRLRTLLRTVPENRTIVLSSRVELPVVWSSYFAPHEMASLTGEDLAIGRDELALLFGDAAHGCELDDRILGVSKGWPIAVLLFMRLASIGSLEASLDELSGASALVDLHAYAEAEIFAGLGESELETFLALCAIGSGTRDELIITVARHIDEDLARLTAPSCSLVSRQGDVYFPLPIARASADATQRQRLRQMLEAASERFALAGHYVRAAELAALLGDSDLACRCLDAVSDPVPTFVPSPMYLRTALQLDTAALLRSKNVLTVLLAGRVEAHVADVLAQKIEEFWSGFSRQDEDHRLRTTLRIARAYLLRSAGQFEAADQSAKGAERDLEFLTLGSPIVKALHCIRAVLALDFMRVDESVRSWEQSGEPLDAAETFFGSDRMECDVLAALASTDLSEIARVFAETSAVLGTWGADTGRVQVSAYQRIAEFLVHGRLSDQSSTLPADRIQPMGASTFAALYETAPPAVLDLSARITIFVKMDAALKQHERSMSIELLRTATAFADGLGLPLHRTFVRIVWAMVDEDMRAALIEEALEIAPAGALRTRIEEFRDDTMTDTSFFKPLMRSLQGTTTTAAGPAAVRIEIFRALVFAHGTLVRVRARELELLVSLALAPSGMTREALIDRLWPDQDEHDAAGTLRSTLHRLRQHFAQSEIIVRDGQLYRLSNDVAIDVIEAESLLHALRGKSVTMSGFERRQLEREFQALALKIPEVYGRWEWFPETERRLVDLRHDVGMLLARDDFQKGLFASAQSWSEQLVMLEPLDEAAAELLFHSILRARGKAEALRWLRRYRDLLAREYGLESSFELDRAYDATEQVTA